jgi:hypothetical protein
MPHGKPDRHFLRINTLMQLESFLLDETLKTTMTKNADPLSRVAGNKGVCATNIDCKDRSGKNRTTNMLA